MSYFFPKNESRIFRYNSVLFIDSKINQLLVTQCNLWVGVLGWIRDLEWCPIKAVLLVKRSFLCQTPTSHGFDSTFSKDEFLNSCFQNSRESCYG